MVQNLFNIWTPTSLFLLPARLVIFLYLQFDAPILLSKIYQSSCHATLSFSFSLHCCSILSTTFPARLPNSYPVRCFSFLLIVPAYYNSYLAPIVKTMLILIPLWTPRIPFCKVHKKLFKVTDIRDDNQIIIQKRN